MTTGTLRKTALIVAAAGVVAAGGLFAGRLFAGSLNGQGSGGEFEHSAPRMFGRLARTLGLSTDQKTQIKSILRSHATEIEAQMTAGVAARHALHDAIKTQPVDEAAIRARAAEAGVVHANGAVLFAKIRAEVLPILTSDQQQKLQGLDEKTRGHGARGAKAFADFLKSDS
jgi:Spy/CpxP family protein refolding chaperone